MLQKATLWPISELVPAMAACPCCVVAPVDQLTDVATFYSNREVMDMMLEWRARPGNARKPHSDMFCSRRDTARVGGSACREEGGCSTREEQCLLYRLTAPFYNAMVPFLLTDKKIYEKTAELKEKAAKIRKDSNKHNARVVEAREEFERMLDTTFYIVKETFRHYIKKCPVR